jgi:hypothetical protein
VKIDRRVLVVAVLLVAIGLAFYLRGPQGGDSPEHRVDSDGLRGTSALKGLAESLGHPAITLQGSFNPDLGTRVLFVFSPTTGFSKGDAQRLSDYLSGGGVVVYASEQGDVRLDRALQVTRLPTFVSGDSKAAGPMLSGVQSVSGAAAVQPFGASPSQVIVLRSTTGQPIGLEQQVGRGRLIAFSDPLPLCNGYLDKADNGRLASDLISLAGGGGQVAFDEFHHAAPAAQSSPLTGWLSTPWGAALSWAVLLLFAGLLLRGRAFGPLLERPGGGDRSSAEYVVAVGRLLHRTRSSRVTGHVLLGAARRAVAQRHGIGATGDALDRALVQRSRAEAQELAAAERELAEAGDRPAALLKVGRRLHRLAYPERRWP